MKAARRALATGWPALLVASACIGIAVSVWVRPPLVVPGDTARRRIDALLVEGAPMLEGPLAALAASVDRQR